MQKGLTTDLVLSPLMDIFPSIIILLRLPFAQIIPCHRQGISHGLSRVQLSSTIPYDRARPILINEWVITMSDEKACPSSAVDVLSHELSTVDANTRILTWYHLVKIGHPICVCAYKDVSRTTNNLPPAKSHFAPASPIHWFSYNALGPSLTMDTMTRFVYFVTH